jgi:hypothetical protein
MSQRTVEEIIEDITSLWYAWPEAPSELFDELRDELERAVMRDTEVTPNGKEAVRRKISPGASIRPVD